MQVVGDLPQTKGARAAPLALSSRNSSPPPCPSGTAATTRVGEAPTSRPRSPSKKTRQAR
jgi:hypothetical protein